VFTGEKKEEKEEIRKTKKEEKNIVIHFVCLCLRFSLYKLICRNLITEFSKQL